MRFLIGLISMFLLGSAHAELWGQIHALDTLGEIRQRYPNASFNKLSLGWMGASSAAYEMTGSGFSGLVYLFFNDFRPEHKKKALDETLSNDERVMAATMASRADDEALIIDSVRWGPNAQITLDMLIKKFGRDYAVRTDSNFSAYHIWEKRGVSVLLDKQGKYVSFIEFMPTLEEMKAEVRAKYGNNAN